MESGRPISEGFARLYSQRGTDRRVSKERTKELYELGFLAGADLYYDFEKYGTEAYINDRRYKEIVDTFNGKFTRLISDKRCLPILFSKNPHYLPDLYIAIHKGMTKFVFENGSAVFDGRDTREIIDEYIEKYKLLIVKPEALSGGRGMYMLSKRNIDAKFKKITDTYALLLSIVMVNEDYAREIAPDSLNTYRAFFFRASDGRNKLFRVIHRFGPVGSRFDNVSGGGCASEIDIETGEMGRVFCPMDDVIFREDHPGTNKQITGLFVPNWQDKLKQLNEIIDTLYFLDYAGMDIAPTPSGLKVVEVNPSPGARLMQFNRPALADEEFKKFVEKQGYFNIGARWTSTAK